jgi:hypothetical protein
LEKAGRVQRLGLVALAGGASADVVIDEAPIMLDIEIGPEALYRLLNALMPNRVGKLEDLG